MDGTMKEIIVFIIAYMFWQIALTSRLKDRD